MDNALHSQIQDLIERGDLPGVDCAATWFGSGRGSVAAHVSDGS